MSTFPSNQGEKGLVRLLWSEKYARLSHSAPGPYPVGIFEFLCIKCCRSYKNCMVSRVDTDPRGPYMICHWCKPPADQQLRDMLLARHMFCTRPEDTCYRGDMRWPGVYRSSMEYRVHEHPGTYHAQITTSVDYDRNPSFAHLMGPPIAQLLVGPIIKSVEALPIDPSFAHLRGPKFQVPGGPAMPLNGGNMSQDGRNMVQGGNIAPQGPRSLEQNHVPPMPNGGYAIGYPLPQAPRSQEQNQMGFVQNGGYAMNIPHPQHPQGHVSQEQNQMAYMQNGGYAMGNPNPQQNGQGHIPFIPPQ